MEDKPFYQRPWFYIVAWGVALFIPYAIALYFQWQEMSFDALAIVIRLFWDAVLLVALLMLWLAFFAQFVLPVQTFEERQKIFDRLLGYMSGTRGPALFVKNGQVIDRAGESERKGPGVLWLDSASSVVTHVDVSFKNTFGPGVHFTNGGEKIAATVDLHMQSKNIGPIEKDQPFAPQGEASDDEYREIQKRRMMTSALTRDGIEVVPSISISFKIDADAIQGDQPGSRFGFSEEAVSKAIINQAIDPTAKPNTLNYNVDWNELPAYLAADLWREFMSKYRLLQLFTPECAMPAALPLESPPPPMQDTEALSRPMSARDQGAFAAAVTEMLHEVNHWLEKVAEFCEKDERKKAVKTRVDTGSRPGAPDASGKTALQVINFMLKERMTNPNAPILDRNGVVQRGSQESREYKVLKARGIRVISVNVNNLRFPPKVEDQLTSQWTAAWLANARQERERIETARSYAALGGQEKAMIDYTTDIAVSVLESKREARGVKDAVKALLVRSRMLLIRNDRMHRRASNELHELEDVLQWLESKQT